MLNLSLNTRLVWLIIAFNGVTDIIGMYTAGMTFVARNLIYIFVIALFLVGSVIYTYKRPSRRIAEMLHVAAAFLAFTAVTTILTYLAVLPHRPRIDDYLAAADHALGLDWLAS